MSEAPTGLRVESPQVASNGITPADNQALGMTAPLARLSSLLQRGQAMIDWTQYDDHNSGDIEYDRGQTMTDKTRPDQAKHPIRIKVERPWCQRPTCLGCQYARITGCAKTAG